MTLQRTEEFAHSINGVEGRMLPRIPAHHRGNDLYAAQKWIASRPTDSKEWSAGARITVEIRFDDECRNGHQTFSITGHIARPGVRDWLVGGCIHDEIARYFPELAPLIKWHLVSTDAPMHYIANTVYHASNRDHNGLLKGERRQIINGKTGKPSWELVAIAPDGTEHELHTLEKHIDSDTAPPCDFRLAYMPWCRVGEGKARDFAAARACAVWPEATDEQLSLPKEELTNLLQDRAAGLLAAFRADMENAGFIWA